MYWFIGRKSQLSLERKYYFIKQVSGQFGHMRKRGSAILGKRPMISDYFLSLKKYITAVNVTMTSKQSSGISIELS